jgi:hypothetical protein
MKPGRRWHRLIGIAIGLVLGWLAAAWAQSIAASWTPDPAADSSCEQVSPESETIEAETVAPPPQP